MNKEVGKLNKSRFIIGTSLGLLGILAVPLNPVIFAIVTIVGFVLVLSSPFEVRVK